MPIKDVTIRAHELGGRWTSIGSDSARGIVVEDLSCDADGWGSRSSSFTLRRNPRVPWPDIGAFAPLEIESQGLIVWSGRVKGTPTTDGADRRLTVNGEGWQYHLDDDSYQQLYVDTKLENWVDARSRTTTTLGLGADCAAGQVSQGGAITLAFDGKYVPTTADSVSVVYDCGVSSIANKVCVIVTTSNNNTGGGGANPGVVFSIDTSTDQFVTSTNIYNQFLTTVGPGPIAIDLAVASMRYIRLRVQVTNGTALTGDAWVQVRDARVFASTSFDSSGFSILRASQVVADALGRATLLLNPSASKITGTGFDIPEFNMTKPDTPRNVINAINSYQAMQPRVTVDKYLEYRLFPSSPTIQVDARSQFDEASAGDASEIYSGVIVNYTGPDGTPGQTQRSQPASLLAASATQPTNPGAEVNTTGWTASSGCTLTRTTVGGEFSSGVAGFKAVLAAPGTANASTAAWTGGSFVPGQGYRLTFDLRTTASENVRVGVVVDGVSVVALALNGTGSFVNAIALDWVQPNSGTPTLVFEGLSVLGVAMTFYFDNLSLLESSTTVVGRRGFRRTFTLDTNMSLTPVAAQQIGDVFLTQHKTVPLKGKIVVTGHGAASKTPSGVNMPPAEILLNTGELVRLIHLIDPDTGAIGREGRIAAVSWDAASDTTTIEIDSQVSNFEAFLGRLGILTGQVK